MKFTPTKIPGVYLIEIQPVTDERGFFARSFCADEFQQYGLNTNFVQCKWVAAELTADNHQMFYIPPLSLPPQLLPIELEDVAAILKVRGYANESSGANLISEITLNEALALASV